MEVSSNDVLGTVAVFGGGPAGLTAAHELAERGFLVTIYERHPVLGGKCRSFTLPGTGIDGRADLPSSMGGHFFMGRVSPNLQDTLHRIPLGDHDRTVLDNLTTGNGRFMGGVLEWGLRPFSMKLSARERFSTREGLSAVRTAMRFIRVLPLKDQIILLSKALSAITSGDDRQSQQLEHLAIAEYMNADRLSEKARRIVDFPMSLGMANSQGVNVRVLARLLQVAISAIVSPREYGDRAVGLALLNGPENETWIDPWARLLTSFGVEIYTGHELTRLRLEHGRITGATVTDSAGNDSAVEADWYVVAVPPDKAQSLMSSEIVAADPQLGRIRNLGRIDGVSIQILLKHKIPGLRTLFTSLDATWHTGNEVLTSAWNLDLSDYGDGSASEYVSVQLADNSWNKLPGIVHGKPGRDCSRDELIDKVLTFLRTHIPNGAEYFAAEAIHSIEINPSAWETPDGWHIDEPLFPVTPPSLPTWVEAPAP